MNVQRALSAGRLIPWLGKLILVCSMLIALCAAARARAALFVVLYTSQDQQFAETVLKDFTRQTGIEVRTVFDSEAVKTVGLANRLLAESKNPRCDVWWSNEELRTRQLAARGVFRATNAWASFGFRSRRIVVNTNLLSAIAAPRSLLELTNQQWRAKFALAYPMFGTTSAHFLALRQQWGAAEWEHWCRALAANQPFLVDGNSVVVKLVARGEAVIGLTDWDDIAAAQREHLPVAAAPLCAECIAIPNTVAVVRGAPHPREAEELFAFLCRPGVTQAIVSAGALEGAETNAALASRVDWDAVVREMESATAALKKMFLR